ncbi:hypothetical protein D3C76_1256290 [compost metagenome]
MRAQLATHQRHAGANVTAQVLAIGSNEVGLGGRTQVDHQASTLGQVERPQGSQPTIHPQALVIFVAIAHPSHCLRWLRNLGGNTEGLGNQCTERCRLFFAAHADDAASGQPHRRQGTHLSEQRLVRIDNAAAHDGGVGSVNHPPLDEAVTAIELKNHHATSN